MKICFWGNIARALKGKTDGGGELQLSLIARALAKAGHEVVVVDYHTPEDFITEEGIKVFKIQGYNKGIRGIRTFTHRLPRLYTSLKSQHADIYYCRIRDFRQILAYRAARKVKAKLIFGMAHDLDAMSTLMRIKNRRFIQTKGLWGIFNKTLIEIFYPFILRRADIVFAQHEGQKEILSKWGIESDIFSNLIIPSPLPVSVNHSRKNFIYVGELVIQKGFHDFFELVNKVPLHTFKVVGQPNDIKSSNYYEQLKSYENVDLLGRLSHTDTIIQIANSKAIISTSPLEGFPNIFIEAWACGIPVISLHVDPGDVIEREQLGHIAHGDLDSLVDALDNFETDIDFADRAKAYVEKTHILNSNRIEEISALFNEVLMKSER